MPLLVPEILKFKNWVKHANVGIDDVIYSTQFDIKYINEAISVNLLHKPLKLGSLDALKVTQTDVMKLCLHGHTLFPSPLGPVFHILDIFSPPKNKPGQIVYLIYLYAC